jgi:hypothetical protein
MGYSVEAGAFVGVVVSSLTDEQLSTIRLFCQDHLELNVAQITFDEDEPSFCIYVQHLEFEQWGHSAYINQLLTETLDITPEAKFNVAELLRILDQPPQELKLILSMHGG